MERLAAESIKAERDAAIRSAIKAKVPWMEIAADYGLTFEEVNEIANASGLTPPRRKPGDLRDEKSTK